ncbi:hypothetical protein M3175_13260 [Robertmurraya korlensis]|uniref:glycoside hydrolase family 38 N-terminal domain-containing protein n=1 Tax=Robertmurraya korlensis TaxID=519977 RepID=UPI00203CCAAD|nr:glycoside hydrolase family 38 C-terminal domain-containing protein [Robertmurraya korlensis]MCM3601707.1 hypothetical protein [Robertmurraya korlensis]
MDRIKEVHILNHTHWDREWYETFEQFRYKLRNGLRYVQNLLDENKIDNFFLDGQTIVLDDYREIVSEREFNRLLNFIREGKIEVGPWYLLADEFLVSGESILKNLGIGSKMAKSLGSEFNIGYLPDTFGHISQMPQILKGYDIDTALVFRGAVSNQYENTWEGTDGSKVFTFVLPLFEGYYQTFLKHKDFIDQTKKYLNDSSPYITSEKVLIMNGADHTFPSPDLVGRIEQLKKEIPGVKFRQSLMSEYINVHNKEMIEGKISGEQRNPSKIFILPGVFSTRSYLKVQNQMCEDQAIGIMEALDVWTNGTSNSEEFKEYVWKLILQNQPHDSICGCSVDDVHNEMETRTQKVLSAIQQFSSDLMNDLFPFEFLNATVENPYLHLINNIPISDVYPVRAKIRIPEGLDLGSIKLFYQDQGIEFDILTREVCEEFIHHILAEPHYARYVTYDVAFNLPFDGVELKSVRVQRIEEEAEVVRKQSSKWIENEYYKIHWNDDGLTITDKITGIVHDNQNTFVSSLDAGDSYNYSPPVNDLFSKAKLKYVSNVFWGKTYQSVTIHYEMELPASLDNERSGPSSERVINRIETVVTLYKGKNMIKFKTKVENAAKDQKLRVGFATSDAEVSYADTAFDLLQRKTLRNKEYDVPKNKEAIMNQYTTYSTVLANEHLLVHRGLQEYEVDHFQGKDTIFLTMIRGVGWLSRRDLRTRGNGAGPGFETPGAQCLGKYEFEYGLVLGQENRSLNHAKMMRQPILVQQSYEEAKPQQLFKQCSQHISFSSFISKQENSFDIRMFNPSEQEASTKIYFGFKPEEVAEVNFTGELVTVYPAKRELNITFKPKEIKTIRVNRKAVGY